MVQTDAFVELKVNLFNPCQVVPAVPNCVTALQGELCSATRWRSPGESR